MALQLTNKSSPLSPSSVKYFDRENVGIINRKTVDDRHDQASYGSPIDQDTVGDVFTRGDGNVHEASSDTGDESQQHSHVVLVVDLKIYIHYFKTKILSHYYKTTKVSNYYKTK